MKLFQNLRLDLEASENGAWFKHPQGFEFKIRRASYEPYREAVRTALAELRARVGGDIPDAALNETMATLSAQHLLVDWRGVVDADKADGAEVPFDRAQAVQILRDPVYAELYSWVAECASRSSGFREAATRATLGK